MKLLQHAKQCLANQAVHNPRNAFISRSAPSSVLQAAQDADDRSEKGEAKSSIDGRLVAIKDNICTRELPTTCGSQILGKNHISPYAATVVEKLSDAGAVIAGKTNMDEFGMGTHSTHSAFGQVQGPRTPGLSPGGSSGGSAVAVATGQCWAALGTDTGGSVRIPASYCGVVGFKASYGNISRYGVIDYANSLDTVGILASNTQATRQVYEIIRGFDPKDDTSISDATRARIAALLGKRERRTKLRIGWPVDCVVTGLEPAVLKVWARTLSMFKMAGHSVEPVPLPHAHQALSAYYVIAPAEASSNLAKYDGIRYGSSASSDRDPDNVLYSGTRGERFGKEAQRRILLGSYSLSSEAFDNYYKQAQKIRRLVREDYNKVFAFPNPLLPAQAPQAEHNVDVIISPSTVAFPPSIQKLHSASAVQIYSDDLMTVPASLAGLPAITVPVKTTESVPYEGSGEVSMGMQIAGQYGDEEMVFEAGRLLELMEQT